MRLHLSFFFFFFFEFRPDSAVSADTGRYGPSRPDFGCVGADSRRIGANFNRVDPRRPDSGLAMWHDAVRRGTDARSAASPPRPAALDAGAPALGPRPCIPDEVTETFVTYIGPCGFATCKALELGSFVVSVIVSLLYRETCTLLLLSFSPST